MLRFIALALVLSAAPPAFAHAYLVRAVPPAGSTVTTAPPALTLFFTEKVEPAFSQVQVLGAHGTALATGKPHRAAGNDRALVVQLPKLGTGRYSVVWHATAADTHKTEGRFTFTVAPK